MEDELTKVAQDSARGGFFLVSGTAVATVVLAIASILIARFLGPELYGQYALALVVPQLLFLFTDLGISQGITKFAATLQAKGETNRLLNMVKHGLLVRAIIGLAIFAVNYVFADIIATYLLQRPELAFYIRLGSISILFQVIFSTATSAFVGMDKAEYHAIATNVQATAKTIASIALILAGLGITGAITGFTVSYIASAVVALPLLWLLFRRKKSSEQREGLATNLKTLFRYGTPLYVSVLLSGFLPLLINVILAFFTTDNAIGNYKAATNFSALLTVLAVPITTVLLPAFSKLNNTTDQKVRDFFRIAVKYTTMIVIPVTLFILISSSEIVQIVYGGTYDSASLFLSISCLVYFLVGMGSLTLPSLFNGLGDTKSTLKMNLITFFTLVILAIPLTQSYGVQGIIVGLLIANTAGTIFGLFKARTKFLIEYDTKCIAKIYLISALSGIAPLLVNNLVNLSSVLSLFLGFILYLVSYVTLMPLTNVVTRSELQRIILAMQNTPLLRQIAKPILEYQERIMQLRTG
jgi:O-antigen/teichoic acid export membrane protein